MTATCQNWIFTLRSCFLCWSFTLPQCKYWQGQHFKRSMNKSDSTYQIFSLDINLSTLNLYSLILSCCSATLLKCNCFSLYSFHGALAGLISILNRPRGLSLGLWNLCCKTSFLLITKGLYFVKGYVQSWIEFTPTIPILVS